MGPYLTRVLLESAKFESRYGLRAEVVIGSSQTIRRILRDAAIDQEIPSKLDGFTIAGMQVHLCETMEGFVVGREER